MDKNEVDEPTQSHILQQLISGSLVKELKKKNVPEEIILAMLREHKDVAELLAEIFMKRPDR